MKTIFDATVVVLATLQVFDRRPVQFESTSNHYFSSEKHLIENFNTPNDTAFFNATVLSTILNATGHFRLPTQTTTPKTARYLYENIAVKSYLNEIFAMVLPS
ncbi:MAG: hypothetical protein JWR50_3121 [Mucilaginibacter sp.]|nr:hypothetical protein [Mucilaginibacter sp.]